MEPVKVGIIGLGFMGTTHLAIHRSNPKSRVVAVADIDPDKRAGDIRKVVGNIGGGHNDRIDLTGVRVYENAAALLADPDVEEVDICLPTYLHADVAIAALRAGKHVLLEKPVALDYDRAAAIVAAARESQRCFTVGLCVRAWPEYRRAFEAVASGRFGKIRSALFKRFSPNVDGNGWRNWYMMDELSGGALLDLHMHDIDEVLYFCGRPKAVSSVGTTYKTGIYDHVFTVYHFAGGAPAVCAEGGWSAAKTAPFEMSFQLICEKATIISGPAGMFFHHTDGTMEKVEFEAGSMPTGWHVEIDHFLDAVRGRADVRKFLPLQDILDGMAVYEAERRSLGQGGAAVAVDYR